MLKVIGYIFMWLIFYSTCRGLATTCVGEGESDEDVRRRKRLTIALAVIMAIFEAAYIYHDLSYPYGPK